MEPNPLKHTERPAERTIRRHTLLFTILTALSVASTLYLIAVKPDFYL